jgi:uncharacterized protein (TIRG00374 family)
MEYVVATLVALTPWRATEVATTREMAKVQARNRERVQSLLNKCFHAGHGLRLILGTAVGFLLLILALRGVSWPQVGSALGSANCLLLAVAVGTVLLTTLAKAIRWRLLFPQEYSRLRLSTLFSVLLIGQMVNALLPARLGEIGRAYLIGEIEGVDKALALSTVIVEKVLDALMLLLLVALIFAFMPLPAWLGRSGIVVSGLLVALLLLVILGAYRSKGTPPVLHRFPNWIPGIGRFDLERRLGSITAGLTALYRRDVAVPLVSWSVLVWALAALTNHVTFLALGVAVPSSPGRVGVFHYICVLSLSLFSVDRSLAMSYGLVLHLIVFAPMMSLGAWFLWKESYAPSKPKAMATLGAGEGADP